MNKSMLLLELYTQFTQRSYLTKADLASIIKGKDERTIQRYISDLNIFLAESELMKGYEIRYYRDKKYYQLTKHDTSTMKKEETLALLKILVAARALTKQELQTVVNNMMMPLSLKEQAIISKALNAEIQHYKPLNRNKPLLETIWHLNELIQNKETLEFDYINAQDTQKTHIIKPLYITYSEFYFYIVGHNKKGQTLFYRIDRIVSYKNMRSSIQVNIPSYMNVGELKKRVYFMYGGTMQKVTFEFNGGIIESVIDRFPTAKLLKSNKEENRYTVEIEVIGDGIIMWLLSQGSRVKVLKPESIVAKYKEELEAMQSNLKGES